MCKCTCREGKKLFSRSISRDRYYENERQQNVYLSVVLMKSARFYFWRNQIKKDMELHKCAAEGLSIVTMDAKVKASAIMIE